MKRSFGFALMLVLFAVPAFAGNKAPTVVIPGNVQVGSTQLPAGQYELTWTGSGSKVQATLLQDKKTVVTFSAKMVEGKNDPGVETNSQGGALILDVIRTNKFSLILDGGPQSGQ
ncbi:MAG: hypothetical protein P4K93_13615 [Terracidiphilus sp.]|nr:hypothetical protein [Terracidiphilus sp.]